MSERRVLLAWEYGRNLGHLSCLGAVSAWLQQADYQSVWIVPEAQLQIAEVVDRCAIRYAAPLLARSIKPRHRPKSFADILLGFGFGEPQALLQAVLAWQKIFARVAPDLVVLDYAPVAQLAAYLFGWRALQVSNGFDAPPLQCPPFGYGAGMPQIEQSNRQLIARLDRSIAAVAHGCGITRAVSLANFLDYPLTLIARIPEADAYHRPAGANYVGPLGAPVHVTPADWPPASANRPKVFAYLRDTPLLMPTLTALVNAGATVLCVCPDKKREIAAHQPHLRIVREPVSIADALRQADAVVNYASTTLVCQSLLAGKPQLMLPIDVEKWTVARRVVQIGAGVMLHRAVDIERSVRLLFAESALLAAGKVASRYAGIDWPGRFDAAMRHALASRFDKSG